MVTVIFRLINTSFSLFGHIDILVSMLNWNLFEIQVNFVLLSDLDGSFFVIRGCNFDPLHLSFYYTCFSSFMLRLQSGMIVIFDSLLLEQCASL